MEHVQSPWSYSKIVLLHFGLTLPISVVHHLLKYKNIMEKKQTIVIGD